MFFLQLVVKLRCSTPPCRLSRYPEPLRADLQNDSDWSIRTFTRVIGNSYDKLVSQSTEDSLSLSNDYFALLISVRKILTIQLLFLGSHLNLYSALKIYQGQNRTHFIEVYFRIIKGRVSEGKINYHYKLC